MAKKIFSFLKKKCKYLEKRDDSYICSIQKVILADDFAQNNCSNENYFVNCSTAFELMYSSLKKLDERDETGLDELIKASAYFVIIGNYERAIECRIKASEFYLQKEEKGTAIFELEQVRHLFEEGKFQDKIESPIELSFKIRDLKRLVLSEELPTPPPTEPPVDISAIDEMLEKEGYTEFREELFSKVDEVRKKGTTVLETMEENEKIKIPTSRKEIYTEKANQCLNAAEKFLEMGLYNDVAINLGCASLSFLLLDNSKKALDSLLDLVEKAGDNKDQITDHPMFEIIQNAIEAYDNREPWKLKHAPSLVEKIDFPHDSDKDFILRAISFLSKM